MLVRAPAGSPERESGRRRRPGTAAALFGPAFIAAVAYVDPGNLATGATGGARYGYQLLWVVVLANGIAMLVQYLSAKLGIATGKNLPEHCRDRYRTPIRLALWVQAEAVIVMTDLAEVIGGAMGMRILFGVPLALGGVLAAVAMLVVLAAQQRGRRAFEAVIFALLSIVLAAFLYQALRAHLDPAALAAGMLPHLSGGDSVLLACGIVGATVMPHAIYLHGGLTQHLCPGSSPRARRRALRATRWDVIFALGLAGVVNIAILLAATVLPGSAGDSLITAYHGFATRLGEVAGCAFAVALLASGLAASAVGVSSGQTVMQGFLRRSVPLWTRRLLSIAPAVAVLACGVDATHALVASQVALSFGLPFALVPLLIITRDHRVMRTLANRRATTAAAVAAATLVLALNAYLITTAVGA